jgi:hypothetical protein
VARPFKGTINFDIRDSNPDRGAFLESQGALEEAKKNNVLPLNDYG